VGLNSTTWNGGGGLNGNWTQTVDANFRWRGLLQETAGVAESNFKETLYAQRNSDGWFAVTGSSTIVQGVLSGQYADGDDTTQLLGSGTFISANSAGVEGDGGPGATNEPDYAGNDECEFEFTLQIIGADVDDGDTIGLRIRNNGTEVTTYTNEPTITVDKPAAAADEPGHKAVQYRRRRTVNDLIGR
jgi:hypothetical protein